MLEILNVKNRNFVQGRMKSKVDIKLIEIS